VLSCHFVTFLTLRALRWLETPLKTVASGLTIVADFNTESNATGIVPISNY